MLHKPRVWSVCGKIEPPIKTSCKWYQNKTKFYTSCDLTLNRHNMDFQLIFTKNNVSAAELNLKLKPQANDIKISSNFTYDAISPLINRI